VLADEDVEEDPDRWCSSTECGQERWQLACQWVWNLRLSLGHAMQGEEQRDIEWAAPTQRPPLLSTSEDLSDTYGPWQWAKGGGRGQMGGSAFPLQDDGTLRCPTGATLCFSEMRQENVFTQQAVVLASMEDCQRCTLREQCLRPGARGNRARRLSAVRRLLPLPATVALQTGVLPATRWRDVPGRALRRTWIAHWRRQFVEVLPRAENPQRASPPSRFPRAMRSHQRWSWEDRRACNAWWGPPTFRITVAGVPSSLPVS
jgi:hypothetical protein